MTCQWQSRSELRTASCIGVKQREASHSPVHWLTFCRSLWHSVPGRGDASQRIQPCIYFLLCQSLMWLERMRRSVFPSQLFYLHAMWPWQVMQPFWVRFLIREMRMVSASQGSWEGWVGIPESVHIFKPYKNVKYLCNHEGIWRDGSGHWVTEMRQGRGECTLTALGGNDKCLNGHPLYHRFIFLCMKMASIIKAQSCPSLISKC